jgi:hypothetical protein
VKQSPRSAAGLLAGLLIGVYFFLLTRDALGVWFSPDDSMNLYRSWVFPLSKLVRANFLFWETSVFYRPLPAVWYRSLYALVGFRPFAFHLTNLLILAANIFLTYAVARRLSDSREVGAVAALLGCYHSSFAALYFDTGYIYDVLCYFFYFAALLVYLRTRQSGRDLLGWPLAAIAALYICALNSKEMAATLPVVLVVYELLYHHGDLRSRLRSVGLGISVTGAITLAFVVGRMTGSESLAKQPGYELSFTLRQLLETSRHFLGNLGFSYNSAPTAALIAIWAAMLALALVSRSRTLRFAWLFLVLTPLPIAFSVPRGAPQYYIPLFGWALYAAALLRRIAERRPQLVFGATIAGLFAFYYSKGWDVDSVRREAPVVRELSTQLRKAHPQIPRGSKLLFVNDPYDPAWENMTFLVQLIYRDDSLIVERLKNMPARPSDDAMAKYQHVFDYSGGRLLELTRPWQPKAAPMIVLSSEGVDVYHEGWQRVDAAHAARPGEMLISRAIGLGETNPAVPPDKPFPAEPFAEVKAKIEVKVNGELAEPGPLFAWPNEIGLYRVDFRVPKNTARGIARVEVSADGVTGPAADIPVK